MDVTKDHATTTVDVTTIVGVEVFSGSSFCYAYVATEVASVAVPVVVLAVVLTMAADAIVSSLSYLSYAAVAGDLSANSNLQMNDCEIGSLQRAYFIL